MESIHGWLGIALVVAAIFHITQNLNQLKRHFRDRRVFVLLVPVLLLIAFFSLAPGEPNRGLPAKELVHRISLGRATDVAKVFGKDITTVVEALRKDSIQVGANDETIEAIAHENHKPMEALLVYFAQ